ncbi:2599_t:CDS:2, partial [Gigaspora rosea]
EEHKAFRLALIRDLIKDSLNPLKRTTRSEDNNVQIIEKDNTNVNKKFRVSANFELPLCRLVVPLIDQLDVANTSIIAMKVAELKKVKYNRNLEWPPRSKP